MKSLKKGEQRVLQSLFRTVYAHTEQVDVGEQWQTQVMRHIRSLSPLQTRPDTVTLLQHCVWRFVVIACLIALLLTAYTFQTEFGTEDVEIQFATDDPVAIMLAQELER